MRHTIDTKEKNYAAEQIALRELSSSTLTQYFTSSEYCWLTPRAPIHAAKINVWLSTPLSPRRACTPIFVQLQNSVSVYAQKTDSRKRANRFFFLRDFAIPKKFFADSMEKIFYTSKPKTDSIP